MSYFVEVQNWFAATGPKVFAAVSILVLTLVVAQALSWLVRYLVDKTNLGQHAKQVSNESFGKTAGRAVFWLVILVMLPALLGALDLRSMLGPVQQLSDRVIGFLPNIIGAGLIFVVGWIVASVLRKTVVTVAQTTSVDSAFKRYAIGATTAEPSNLLGMLAFALVILPVGISALDALAIEAISNPGKEVLVAITSAIPKLLAAGLLIALGYLVARFVAKVVEQILLVSDFDAALSAFAITGADQDKGRYSRYAGQITGAAIVLFALIEGAKLLQFAIISSVLTEVLTLGGRILMGLAVIGFGAWAAGRIAQIVKGAKNTELRSLSVFVRVAIIALTTAMGLGYMGLADEIIIAAFVGVIGAASVAGAIAFGLGGRDFAAKTLESWSGRKKK